MSLYPFAAGLLWGQQSWAGIIYMAPDVFLKSDSSFPVDARGWEAAKILTAVALLSLHSSITSFLSSVPLAMMLPQGCLCAAWLRTTLSQASQIPFAISAFVWRDWSRGVNFIFVLRSNLVLNFSFVHQACTCVNYTGVCEQTPCLSTWGQITLFVSRNANKITMNTVGAVQWEYRGSAGRSLCFTDKSMTVGENSHRNVRGLTVQLTHGCTVNNCESWE